MRQDFDNSPTAVAPRAVERIVVMRGEQKPAQIVRKTCKVFHDLLARTSGWFHSLPEMSTKRQRLPARHRLMAARNPANAVDQSIQDRFSLGVSLSNSNRERHARNGACLVVTGERPKPNLGRLADEGDNEQARIWDSTPRVSRCVTVPAACGDGCARWRPDPSLPPASDAYAPITSSGSIV